jgi:hypothetical protein
MRIGNSDVCKLVIAAWWTLSSASAFQSSWSMHGACWAHAHACVWRLCECDQVAFAGFDAAGASASQFVRGPSSNGALLWRFTQTMDSVDATASADPSPSHEAPSPAVDSDDTSYIANSSGGLVAFAYNGSVRWTVPCPAFSYAVTSPALTDSSVFFLCSSPVATTGILASTATGAVLWKAVLVLGWVVASPVVGTMGDGTQYAVIASDHDAGTVMAFRLADGGKAWLNMPSLGSPIRSTPCFDGVHWYVFSIGGLAAAISGADGSQLWNATAFGAGLGPTGSCAVSHDGMYVAAGGDDFTVRVLLAATGSVVCEYTTGGRVHAGLAATNSTFIVSSTSNTVRGFAPIAELCVEAFVVSGLPDPMKPAVDGAGIAYVSHAGGLVAIDTDWLSSESDRVLWVQNMTGEGYWTPAIGAGGFIVAASRNGGVAAVGASAAFVTSHMRDAVMRASAVFGDPTSLAELLFLCSEVGVALSAFVSLNPGAVVDAQVASAVNQSCAMYSVVLSGSDPSGMPSNFADYEDAGSYVSDLQSVWEPLLADVIADVQNLSSNAASLQQQLNGVNDVLDGYASRASQLLYALNQSQLLESAIVGTILSIEGRVEFTTLALQSEIAEFVLQWLAMTVKFAQAAEADLKDGVDDVKECFGDLGKAVHSVLNPFKWGRIGGDVKQAMANLAQGFEHIAQSPVWAAEAVVYGKAWLELTRVRVRVRVGGPARGVCPCRHPTVSISLLSLALPFLALSLPFLSPSLFLQFLSLSLSKCSL